MRELEILAVRDRAAWRRWLARFGARSPGIWLVFGKKDSGQASPSYEEAVEEARHEPGAVGEGDGRGACDPGTTRRGAA